MIKQKILFRDMGRMDYQEAWDFQESLLAENVKIKSSRWQEEKENTTAVDLETVHHLLFVEHPPVYTLGKSGKIENVLITDEERKK